jgi:hypothetical protein
MIKICKTCGYWKLYMREDDMCACEGRSSGSNPGSQLYTSPYNTCEAWTERPSYAEFRKAIKVKRSMLDD